jgi:hypothetical protein
MNNGKREWWEEPPPNELEGLPQAAAARSIDGGITTIQQVRDGGEDRLRSLRFRGAGIECIKVWLPERRRPEENDN